MSNRGARDRDAAKMSIKTENGVYESEPVSTSDGMCLEVFETSGRFIYVPKMENSEADSAMLDVFENTWESEDSILPEDEEVEPAETGPYRYEEESSEAGLYSEKLSRSTEKIDFKEEEDEKLVYEEEEEDEEEEEEKLVYEDSAMEVDNSDDASFENYQEEEEAEDADVSDEETIATFLTANGQRLALYAVEDSDQVFAVAVYDESGEPPTNFQFLMKSDVERLIGEGAVRTVKKPTRMKEQLLTDAATVYRPGDTEQSSEQEPQTVDDELNESKDGDDQVCHEVDDKTTISTKMERTEEESSAFFDDQADSCLQPRITSLIAHNFSSSNLNYHQNERDEEAEAEGEKESKLQISSESGELVERSTVDSLLMDSDGSDGELTFADVEETLGNLRSHERASSECLEAPPTRRENGARTETVVVITATIADIARVEKECLASAATDFPAEARKKTNIVRRSHASSSLIRRGNDGAKRQRGFPTTSLLVGSNERVKAGPEIATEATATSPKAKRPRKQQLTSVNRGDSEIIIQPATFPPSQEEQTKKKRKVHRPRRKPGGRTNVRYKLKSSMGKRLHGEKRAGRRTNAAEPRRYEVIEIDVDPEDRPGTLDARRRSIVEITIDDGAKDKGSSDKENEVIMVGDSDDEIQPETSKAGETSAVSSSLRCEYCSRTFRRKKSHEMHARICSESPLNAAQIDSEQSVTSNDEASAPKKQYACKICHEEFDVVVVLARHVRAMHSLRKKGNPNAAGNPEESTTVNALRTRRERAKSGDANDTGHDTNAPNNKSQNEHLANSATAKTNAAAPGRGRRRRRRRKLTRTRTETRSNSDSRTGWKGDKLYCSECAKWFSSAASLASHSLRHATKKTEKQTRRCEKCEKNFKTRLLYIRHTKMHDRIEKLQKKLHHTRQASTVKLATLRKRTRPRKL